MSPPLFADLLTSSSSKRRGGSTYTTEDTQTQLMNILQLVEATRMNNKDRSNSSKNH